MENWATQRLNALIAGAQPPPVVQTLQLGTLDAWGEGWAKKTWQANDSLLNGDGSLFGGYIAALADQILAFAAMTVVPADKYFRTTQLNVSFFKLGKAQQLQIEGRVVAQSRQLIHVRAEFRDVDGELMADASAVQVLHG